MGFPAPLMNNSDHMWIYDYVEKGLISCDVLEMTFVAMEEICSKKLMEIYVPEVRVFCDDQVVMTYPVSVLVRVKMT